MFPAPRLYLFPRLSQQPALSQLVITEGLGGAGRFMPPSLELVEGLFDVGGATAYKAASLDASIFTNWPAKRILSKSWFLEPKGRLDLASLTMPSNRALIADQSLDTD